MAAVVGKSGPRSRPGEHTVFLRMRAVAGVLVVHGEDPLMSLILAIEPDRRQVAQLISIVRQVPGAELILADTTERALESIGNGVPDLILVPALLSPQDDAALAAALRVIATAAHVQMLTIPTFATAKARPKSRGVLSAFRRKPVEDAPLEGCDPKVFAEQISSYLERASEERAAAALLEDNVEEMAADPYAAPAQQFGDLPEGFEEIAEIATPAVEEIYAEPIRELSFEAAPEPPMLAAEEPAEEVIDTVEEFEPIVADRYVDVEPLPEDSIAAAAPEPMALEEFAATLARTDLPSVVLPRAEPLMASAPAEQVSDDQSFELDLDIDLTTELEEVVPEVAFADSSEPQPTLDAFLADFDHDGLPVIEEVRAEQWMDTAAQPEEEAAEQEDDEQTQADIDLSHELDAVSTSRRPNRPRRSSPSNLCCPSTVSSRSRWLSGKTGRASKARFRRHRMTTARTTPPAPTSRWRNSKRRSLKRSRKKSSNGSSRWSRSNPSSRCRLRHGSAGRDSKAWRPRRIRSRSLRGKRSRARSGWS